MIHFILRCAGILLEILFYVLIVSIIVSVVSCSSISVQPGGNEKTASYHQTEKEIQNILKGGGNLTPAQKIVLQHAAADLKDAEVQSRQQAKLQEKLISASEKAGAGKLVYYIMYFAAFLIAAFVGLKILRKFGF